MFSMLLSMYTPRLYNKLFFPWFSEGYCRKGVGGGGGVWASNQIFEKGGLTGPQLSEGGCWERGEGCNFHIKNKWKSEIFNDKKSLLAKIFFACHD